MARIKFVQKWINVLRGREDSQLVKAYYGDKFIYLHEDSQDVIYEQLISGKPCLICRFGSTELNTIRQFFEHRYRFSRYSKNQRYIMSTLSGFFPTDDYNLNKFACEMISITRDIDILGCWFRPFEEDMCRRYLKDSAKLVHLNSICPIWFKRPWSRVLHGKKVLVIHPFEKSIQEQYKKREKLFENPETLPEFELVTMKPVQSLADNKEGLPYETWFDALNDMKSKIKEIDFDIAIIGAGAYGMFLAQYVKTLGRQAIHGGGAVQLLFGIKGSRWDSVLEGSLYNDYWIRPDESERPKGAEKVEGGCYW